MVVPLLYSTSDDTQIQGLVSKDVKKGSFSSKVVDILHTVLEELLAPPTLGSVSFKKPVEL